MLSFQRFRNTSAVTAQQYLATRATSAGLAASGSAIVNTQIYRLAATILPNAPFDPISGLQVPTIAVGTYGGVSVINFDGSVVNSAGALGVIYAVEISKGHLWANANGNETMDFGPVSGLTASFAIFKDHYASTVPPMEQSSYKSFAAANGILGTGTQGGALELVKAQSKITTNSAITRINSVYNTGWKLGDIRRVYLADSVVETLSASTELVVNGNAPSGSTGWTIGSSFSFGSGVITSNATGTSDYAYNSGSAYLVAGKTYLLSWTITASNANFGPQLAYTQSGGVGTYGITSYLGSSSTTGSGTAVFTPSQNGVVMFVRIGGHTGNVSFSKISIQEVVADRSYKAFGALKFGSLTKALSSPSASNQLVAYSGFSASNYLQEPYSADLDFGTGEWSVGSWITIPTGNAAAGTIADRSYSSGSYITLGIDSSNHITATAYDGTTTRTATTSAAYNAGVETKAEAVYRADGSLAILVNGVQVAVTYGNPLATLTNTSAVLTIGNNRALSAAFPSTGTIALFKASATAPTPDQAAWIYEQEKELFRDGANCLLPDAGAIISLSYDDATDRLIAVSASNESDWTGLVRTNVIAVPSGSNILARAGSGIKLNARSTTTPGVDVTIPAWNLREELVKRAEAAAKKAQPATIFDFTAGFTCTTVNGNTAITSVASLAYPAQGTLRGATVTGSGIPASTTIVDIVGTTIYLSKACTASASSVQVSFLDFILPIGYETRVVSTAGATKQEGATKDWTRSFDGFREKVTFGTAPGYSAFVEIEAVRSITQ